MSDLESVIQFELPSGGSIGLVRRRFRGAAGPRVAIVAGIRGDTPEGIHVAHRIASFLEDHEQALQGCVDVYPCVNPLAAHRGSRLWPFFDVDLNRLFPGRADGHPPDRIARALADDVTGADLVVELRGAHPAFREVSQAHVRFRDQAAAELATCANVSVIWRRAPGPAAPGTFAHQFPGTLVLEGGSGNRITPGVGKELVDGVLHLLATVGVLSESSLPFHWAGLARPAIVTDAEVVRVRAERGGLFLPVGSPWSEVAEGQEVGRVIDPASGAELEVIASPATGRLMALREHPVVLPGSMVARVVVL